ncbi:MAG: hypothetical protein PHV68_09220, partial [Candidatus Gastranaerophilales bacterium]|nr:hypothetical protein [Candidatus Gastranaerophilales bacterium]
LILNNGSLVIMRMVGSACNWVSGDYTRCGFIYIDVNGFKKPNIWGKDIFEVEITSNAIVPQGAKNFYDPDTTCVEGSTATDNLGNGCSAKYLYE